MNEQLSKKNKSGRIWWEEYRHVDDVVAIFKIEEVDNIIKNIISVSKTIQFTSEIEIDGKLLFMYFILVRNKNNKVELKIYRKQTST